MTPSVRNQILEGGRDELGAVVVRDEAGSVAAQGGHVVSERTDVGAQAAGEWRGHGFSGALFGDGRSWLR